MTRIASVKGVFFDYGGVIEDLKSDEVSFGKGVSIIREMLATVGIGVEEGVLASSLRSGQHAYEQWYRLNGFRGYSVNYKASCWQCLMKMYRFF